MSTLLFVDLSLQTLTVSLGGPGPGCKQTAALTQHPTQRFH